MRLPGRRAPRTRAPALQLAQTRLKLRHLRLGGFAGGDLRTPGFGLPPRPELGRLARRNLGLPDRSLPPRPDSRAMASASRAAASCLARLSVASRATCSSSGMRYSSPVTGLRACSSPAPSTRRSSPTTTLRRYRPSSAAASGANSRYPPASSRIARSRDRMRSPVGS